MCASGLYRPPLQFSRVGFRKTSSREDLETFQSVRHKLFNGIPWGPIVRSEISMADTLMLIELSR